MSFLEFDKKMYVMCSLISKYFEADVFCYEKQKKNEVLVDNTIKKMLPVFLLCLMMFDNESILKSNSFGGFDGFDGIDLNYDIYIPELD